MEVFLGAIIILMLISTSFTGFVRGIIKAVVIVLGVFFLFAFGIILFT